MKSNLAQHPWKNKCTDFKEEQCKTCLVKDEPQGDYVIEDMVIKTQGDDDALFVFAMYSEISSGYCYIGEPYAEQGEMILLSQIRHATVAELKAKRRLTEAEQALAEVS